MKRVTLRVESLDGRILPGGSSGAINLGPPTSPGLGSKPGGVGDGVQVNGSRPSACGSTLKQDTDTGTVLGGSKGVARPGDRAPDAIVLGGSKPDTGVEMFGGSKPTGTPFTEMPSI
jgi:hypothetical protein